MGTRARARRPRYLHESERVLFESRPHARVLAGPLAWLAASLVVLLGIGFVTSPDRGSDAIDALAGIVAVLLVARFGARVARWHASRVIVTDARVLQSSGVLRRRVSSMPYARIRAVEYRRSLLGRVFGYGDIHLECVGSDPGWAIERVRKPDDLYRAAVAAVAPGGSPDRVVVERRPRPDEADTEPLPRVIV